MFPRGALLAGEDALPEVRRVRAAEIDHDVSGDLDECRALLSASAGAGAAWWIVRLEGVPDAPALEVFLGTGVSLGMYLVMMRILGARPIGEVVDTVLRRGTQEVVA